MSIFHFIHTAWKRELFHPPWLIEANLVSCWILGGVQFHDTLGAGVKKRQVGCWGWNCPQFPQFLPFRKRRAWRPRVLPGRGRQEHVWRSYVICEILNTKYIARKRNTTEKKFSANLTTKNGHNFLNSSVQYFLKHFLNSSVQYCVAASLMKPFRPSPLDRKPFNLVENGAEF